MVQKKSFFSLAKRSFAFCFGGIWLFCGALFLIIGIYIGIETFRVQERFKNAALISEGMVLTKSMTGSSNNKTYQVGYRFRAPDGTVVKNEVKVSEDYWDRITERGPIRVAYLPDDPKANRIEGAENRWTLILIFTGIGLFFVPLGGWIFLKGFRSVLRDLKLEMTGMPTEATVTSVVLADVSFDGVPQWNIRYRYQDHRGRNYTARSPPLPPEEAKEWQVGDKATVKFELKAPGKSAWIGKL